MVVVGEKERAGDWIQFTSAFH
jgi:hypothetical protein